MITGRTIANGSSGSGEASVRKTPLIAALQATANQSVYGIMTASQVVRRWPGVRLGAFEAEPQTDRDNPMGHQLDGPRSERRWRG